MFSSEPREYKSLERYVGKVFYQDYLEVEVVMLLGGECGPCFFLCKMVWSGDMFCADPIEVLSSFDDDLKPFKDVDFGDE